MFFDGISETVLDLLLHSFRLNKLMLGCYTRYWYIWDSLNGTLDKIGHGTGVNVYWVTKNEGTGMTLKTMGH